MNPNCPDPKHVQDWFCPTCDAEDRKTAPPVPDPPESLYDADDGRWIDPDMEDR